MKVEIDLTEAEARMVRSFCLLRPMKAASEMLRFEESVIDEREAIAQDLENSGPVFEGIRQKLVEALYVAGAASRA